MCWKGLITLSNMSATDVSSCHVSSLSRAEQSKTAFLGDKEETRQEETSVERMLERVTRPVQNTKKLCLTPFSHRDTAGERNGGIPESPSMPLCRPVKSDPGRVINFFFKFQKFLTSSERPPNMSV